MIHWFLGLVFLISYECLWRFTGIIRSLQWSLIFGAFIGVLGIIGWKIIFKLHKDPPKLNFVHFYIHLFFAHLIFSVSTYFVYNFIN